MKTKNEEELKSLAILEATKTPPTIPNSAKTSFTNPLKIPFRPKKNIIEIVNTSNKLKFSKLILLNLGDYYTVIFLNFWIFWLELIF